MTERRESGKNEREERSQPSKQERTKASKQASKIKKKQAKQKSKSKQASNTQSSKQADKKKQKQGSHQNKKQHTIPVPSCTVALAVRFDFPDKEPLPLFEEHSNINPHTAFGNKKPAPLKVGNAHAVR